MANNSRPNQPSKYKQGYYTLQNPQKYLSDPSQVIYRSGLELKYFRIFDLSESILKWGSEIIGIPYNGPDNKPHTYYPDFYIEKINNDNELLVDRIILEIKPHIETMRILENKPPEPPKRHTKKSLETWEYGIREFMKNRHKWIYAKEYARQRSMLFKVATEKTLNQFIK